ncbi:MAG: hypothetical protein ACJAY2_001503 [Pseudomonadales bacterium]|jgi:hypothetical protein
MENIERLLAKLVYVWSKRESQQVCQSKNCLGIAVRSDSFGGIDTIK